MEFAKLEALGNDFVVVDARGDATGSRKLTAQRAQRLADRRRGVGCDQVLWLHPAAGRGAFAVAIRNADGSEAEQCGNGMRALAAWLDARGELVGRVVIETAAGDVELGRSDAGGYHAELPGPRERTADELGLPAPPSLVGAVATALVSVGNPHLVVFVDESPDAALLARTVAAIEHEPAWRNAVNVGVCRRASADRLLLRVHERGAGPTPACGSGACAAAWIAGRRLGVDNPVAVEQPGGSLVVDWQRPSARILAAGAASVVFQGRIE
jgi:diaminopimelate epimerase